MDVTRSDSRRIKFSMSVSQEFNLYQHSEWYRAYSEVQKCKNIWSSVSKIVLYAPIGISRQLCINLLFLSMSTRRIIPFIGDYPLSMIILACAYFGLDVIRSRLVDYCFSDPGFHHVPILIDTMIQLYGFHHPYVLFLRFRLGLKWLKAKRDDFPTFHHFFKLNLCLLSEQDFRDRLLMVYADIVISPTYSQRHTLFICSGCLCLVRPDRDACVTMCCARPMHLRCYRTDLCTACLIRINNQLFYIRGEGNLNHAPTAPSYRLFHPVYYPVTDPRYFHGRNRITARPYFLAVRPAPNGPVFFNWILKAFMIFATILPY